MESAQLNQIQAINHLDQKQYASFLAFDLKKFVPQLEELSVVFAPDAKEIESAMKNMVIKVCKSDKTSLIGGVGNAQGRRESLF